MREWHLREKFLLQAMRPKSRIHPLRVAILELEAFGKAGHGSQRGAIQGHAPGS
jgi:hypothetical protein